MLMNGAGTGISTKTLRLPVVSVVATVTIMATSVRLLTDLILTPQPLVHITLASVLFERQNE